MFFITITHIVKIKFSLIYTNFIIYHFVLLKIFSPEFFDICETCMLKSLFDKCQLRKFKHHLFKVSS